MPNSDTLANTAADLYLNLLRDAVTRSVFPEFWQPVVYDKGSWQRVVMAPFMAILKLKGYHLCKRFDFHKEKRTGGSDWPPEAETMIGSKRLENIRHCCTRVIADNVPGDFCETGVWRGGSCIYMRGILKALGDTTRKVWVCDSFEGLPKSTHPEDLKWNFWKHGILSVSLEQVKDNFSRYGLLDDQVEFVVGWFNESLPRSPISKLSVLRLDGDLYESTWDAISNLYPKVSVGGYVIVDDYGGIDSCRKAIDDYRKANGIRDPIEAFDTQVVFWRKS